VGQNLRTSLLKLEQIFTNRITVVSRCIIVLGSDSVYFNAYLYPRKQDVSTIAGHADVKTHIMTLRWKGCMSVHLSLNQQEN